MRVRSVSILSAALFALGLALAGCGQDDGASCVETNGGVEQCDNIDNDCDGFTDEDANCVCTPVAETCDNADNDCDGQIDEDLTRTCQAGAQSGTETCAAGVWGTCQTTGPAPVEVCDNADNDGDGQVDEGLQRACNTGCGTGIENCVAGAWVNCDAPAPETEVCDGRDNNCDGQIDEGVTRTCETDCGQGQETCSLGNWFGCNAPRPAPEGCDGQDNDCDGQTDEDLSKTCDTACGEGAMRCVNGVFDQTTCTARQPAAQEDCTNNIDDNCDGQTNEGCATCTAGTTSACVGVDAQQHCQTGNQVCGPTGEWGACQLGAQNLASPTDEVCNGRDDDCDGGIDETFALMGQACGGGANGAPLDEGECLSGTWACSAGAEICQGARLPQTEACNSLDDDCNGVTDDNLASIDEEQNGTCASARNKGTIPETDPDLITVEETLTWNGSVYPDGDVDYFMVTVEEAGDFCIPGLGQDDDYRVVIMLYNVPAGVAYDLCIEVVDGAHGPDSFCGEDRILEENCLTEASTPEGELIHGYEISAGCMLNDDSTVLIKVKQHAGSAVSCEPYTVSIYAESIVQ